jgi:hypothetical protein
MNMEELSEVKGRQWEKWEDVDVSFLYFHWYSYPTLTIVPALIKLTLHAGKNLESDDLDGQSCMSESAEIWYEVL